MRGWWTIKLGLALVGAAITLVAREARGSPDDPEGHVYIMRCVMACVIMGLAWLVPMN